MFVPDRMMRCRLRPFENENARNEHRVWPGAGSAEAIEKFLYPSITVFRCPATFFLTIWISGKQFRFRGSGPAKSRFAATYLRGDGTAKDEDTGIRILLPLVNAAHALALVSYDHYNVSGPLPIYSARILS